MHSPEGKRLRELVATVGYAVATVDVADPAALEYTLGTALNGAHTVAALLGGEQPPSQGVLLRHLLELLRQAHRWVAELTTELQVDPSQPANLVLALKLRSALATLCEMLVFQLENEAADDTPAAPPAALCLALQ